LMVVPSLLTNAWQAFAGPHLRALLRRLWSMQLMICAGTWLTAGSWTDPASARYASAALGLALVVGTLAARWQVRAGAATELRAE
ncbi:MAG: sulfite exporter TauE/SafE family protein, partial [Acidimicrobiales bacterium]